MEFQEHKISEFLSNFKEIKQKIRNFPGCEFLELYRDKDNEYIFFTYSKWKEESDLENYRQSELFKGVWATTKPMFNSKAQAWSVDTVASLK